MSRGNCFIKKEKKSKLSSELTSPNDMTSKVIFLKIQSFVKPLNWDIFSITLLNIACFEVRSFRQPLPSYESSFIGLSVRPSKFRMSQSSHDSRFIILPMSLSKFQVRFAFLGVRFSSTFFRITTFNYQVYGYVLTFI